MLFTCVKGIGYPSTLPFFDNTTRLIAGPRKTPKRFELTFLAYLQGRKLQILYYPFSRKLSGDDGIRTRDLRLAKALLSR